MVTAYTELHNIFHSATKGSFTKFVPKLNSIWADILQFFSTSSYSEVEKKFKWNKTELHILSTHPKPSKGKAFLWLWWCVFSKSSLLLCPHPTYSPARIRPSPLPPPKYRFPKEFIQISVMLCLTSQCNKAFGSRAFFGS